MSPVAELVGRVASGMNAVVLGEATDRTSADRKATGPRDELALAIVHAARLNGNQISAEALLAGLPLVGGRLPFEHAATAARRADLVLTEDSGAPLRLDDHDLPTIILLHDGSVRLLTRLMRRSDGSASRAVVIEPGGCEHEIDVSELELLAGPRHLRIRPAATFTATGAEPPPSRRHDWFLDAFRGSRRIYREAILATLAINVLALALPLFTMNVYDRVLPNNAEATLWALAIGAILATMFDFAIKTLRATFVDTAGRRADVLLSSFIYARLLGAKLPERPTSAGVRANTLREFETLREFFNSVTLTTFGDLPFLVIFLAVIAVVAGPLVLVPLAAIPLVLVVAYLTQRALSRAKQAAFQQAAQKNSVVVETVVGLESIKAAGAESWAASRWEQAVADHVRTGLRIRHLSSLGVHLVHAFQTIIQVLMVIAGFYMVVSGQITAGALIAATMLAGRALTPLGAIAMIISRLHQTRLAYDSISEIVHAPQERPEGARFLNKSDILGAVSFENVSFNYDRQAPRALHEVSFTIQRGERVGIIGAIGSGKTTLLRLVQGLNTASSGQVLIDGIGIGQYDPAIIRRNVGLHLQEAELFSGTIRSNIALADPAASDEIILKAAHAAGALDWVARLPAGFDTPVRERGSGLSSGQRQSIALARTLARNPRIVLLDEPTSDMDTRTEQLVIRRLKDHLKGRTLVVVTHRPAMLDLVDRLIVIEGGRKIADGAKAQVLTQLKTLAEQRTEAQTPGATGAVHAIAGGSA